MEEVRKHLKSIPAYESHSRRDSSKLYLPSHLTISELYKEYKTNCNRTPVSRCLYEKEFHKMNLRIKKPHVDTCQLCDKLSLQLKLSGDPLFQTQLSEHHEEADKAYDAKSLDKTLSKNDPSRKTITFDMQQCLPTPLLRNSISFYKRQLWTFNMTVHDCDSGNVFCFLWHECVAGRGANDVGSCIYHYLVNQLDPKVKHLTMYSDSCGGQNRNSYIAVMCMTALQNSPNLETIDHKFLIPGHTHMESDVDHSVIEKKKKKYNGEIHHPHDWVQLIRQVGKKDQFTVHEMSSEDVFKLFFIIKRPSSASQRRLRW